MSLIDITRTLSPSIATWPGDTPFQLIEMAQLQHGDSINLSTLTLSAHTGTHIDAPYHFSEHGKKIHEMDLSPYWGIATVATIQKSQGPLFPHDFAHIDLQYTERLLVHSSSSEKDPSIFHTEFVYPSPELADFLGSKGVVLYGTDTPSMDASDSKLLPGHHAMLRNGIAILEGLNLSGVADGMYELSALPLKIHAGDGSPVRAVLRML